MEHDRPQTPREVAKDLIRFYVLRGDTVDDLADGMMGSYCTHYGAQIGGYLWFSEDLHTPNGKPIQLKRYQIGVAHMHEKRVMQVFSLPEIYKEIQSEAVTGRQEQLTLL